MPYGRKPKHRSGEKQHKKYLKAFPPSLRNNYGRIHEQIVAVGARRIEWYHLKGGETRYRTQDQAGLPGKIFAWLKIYSGWLCAFIPQHDPSFRRRHAVMLKEVGSDYQPNCP